MSDEHDDRFEIWASSAYPKLHISNSIFRPAEKAFNYQQSKIGALEKKLAIAIDALDHYAHRMGSGGSARAALAEIGNNNEQG